MNIKILFDKKIIELLEKENKYLNLQKKNTKKLKYIKKIIFKPKYKDNDLYNLVLKEYYINTKNYRYLSYREIEDSIEKFLKVLNKNEIELLKTNKFILNPKKIKINSINNFIKKEKKFIEENIDLACNLADALWSCYCKEQDKYELRISKINNIKIKLLTIKEYKVKNS